MNNVLQILISALDLYYAYKKRDYEFDKYTEDQLREKLKELNTVLSDIPDLPEK